MKSFIKKLTLCTVIITACTPVLHAFDLEKEYAYLGLLLQNGNASAFAERFNTLLAEKKPDTKNLKQLITLLEADLEQATIETQAKESAGVSGSIVSTSKSQLFWGVAELVLAYGLFKLHKWPVSEDETVLNAVLGGSIGSGLFGIFSLKNCLVSGRLAYRFSAVVKRKLTGLNLINQQLQNAKIKLGA